MRSNGQALKPRNAGKVFGATVVHLIHVAASLKDEGIRRFTCCYYREFISPCEPAPRRRVLLPSGFKGLIAIVRNWTFTLFYVMSELWGTAILSLIFWGFANEVTSVNEARRYYGVLMVGANIAGIFSGQASVYFSGDIFIPAIPYGHNAMVLKHYDIISL